MDEINLYDNVNFLLAEKKTSEVKFLLETELPNLGKESNQAILSKLYNLLGIIYVIIDENISRAIRNFSIGLEICKEYSLNFETAIINNSIALLHYLVGNYKDAINTYKESYKILSTLDFSDAYKFKIATECIICISHYHINEDEYINEYIDDILSSTDDGEPLYIVVKYLFLSIYYYKIGDEASSNEYISRLIEHAKNTKVFFYDIYNYEIFTRFMIERNLYSEFIEISTVLTNMLKNSVNNRQLLRFSQLFCDACVNFGDGDALFLNLERLYYYDRKQIKANKEELIDIMNLINSYHDMKIKHETLEKENSLLKNKAETDELTGLNNRFRFNDYFEHTFNDCLKNSKLIAVEFFDIDNFKGYNDTYGHEGGNRCLVKIANVLKELEKDGIFCSRFGGDEFVIIFTNLSLNEIYEFSKELKERVCELNIEHRASKVSNIVTISQGISYVVPSEDITSNNLLKSADENMYISKEKGRNTITMEEYK